MSRRLSPPFEHLYRKDRTTINQTGTIREEIK